MAQAIAGGIVVVDAIAVVCAIGMMMCAIGYVNSVHQGVYMPHAGTSNSGNLAAFARGFLGWAMSLFEAVAGGLVIAVFDVVDWVMSPLMSLFNQVRYSWLPWVLHQAATTAEGLANGVYNTVTYDLHAVEGALESEIAGVERAVVADIGAVETALQGEIGAVWRGVEAVESTIQRELQGIEQGVQTEITALEHVTEISLQNLEQGVTREIDAVERGIEAQIGATTRGLEGDIQGVEGWVRGLIGASVLPAIAALGLGLRALEQDVTKTNEECVNPMCRNLGGLSNILGLLGQLGVDALMLALLAELLHDPAAVAREVNDVAVPIVRGAGGFVLGQAA